MLHSCSLQGPRATASAQHTRYESISLFNFYFTSMIQFLISIIQYLIGNLVIGMTDFRMSKRTIQSYFSSSSASTPHTNESTSEPKKSRVEFSHSDLIGDPGKRKPIDDYQPEIRDQVKRAYALNGPTQPRDIIFPRKWMSGEFRSFQKTWFDEFDWLEYSEYKGAVYCLYCYLFFNSSKPEKFGSSVFAHQGYVN